MKCKFNLTGNNFHRYWIINQFKRNTHLSDNLFQLNKPGTSHQNKCQL